MRIIGITGGIGSGKSTASAYIRGLGYDVIDADGLAKKFASDPDFGNPYLGGQNDTAVFAEGAKNIKFQNQTIYDQGCNEGLQNAFVEYLKGTVTKEEAMSNFYKALKEKYPAINVPEA